MCGFMLRIVMNAVVLFVLVFGLPGIFVDTLGGALLGVLLVGFANALIRPLLFRGAKPVCKWRLGGYTFLTNIVAPVAVIAALPGYQILSVLSSMAGLVCMTAFSFTLSKVVEDR